MQALGLGISKRSLLQDYYPDELAAIFGEYGVLHGRRDEQERVVSSPLEFLGEGGERIGS